jgi:putative Holliday junction resolvase
MRAMAVDLGTVRIGLAITDPGKTIAAPFETLPAGDASADDWPREVARRLADIARDEQVDTLVVGLPRSLAGRDTASTEASRRVIDALRAATDLHVEAWDERLSSVEAERMLVGAGQRRRSRTTARDRVAAAIILQSWLQARAVRGARDSEPGPADAQRPSGQD